MTTPAAPGAPEGGQNNSGQDPAPGAQDPQQQAPGAPANQPDPQDISALPEWAQKVIRDARADAGKARTSAKQQAAEEARNQLLADISKTLGLDPNAEPTVEQLQEQLSELSTANEQLQAAQTENFYRETIRSAAGAAGADADALMDSASFRDAVQDELDDDFSDDDLVSAVKKVTAEYAKKPRFAAHHGAARSGGDFAGGPAGPPNIDQQIADAEKNRDFAAAIALKRRRARIGQ